jgi:hypothetical protein
MQKWRHCMTRQSVPLPTIDLAQESVSGATLLDAAAPQTQQSTGYRG